MNEPVQQHSDIIEQLQSKIQTLTDENRLLKQRMDEAGILYADIVAGSNEAASERYDMRVCSKDIAAELLEMTFGSGVDIQEW